MTHVQLLRSPSLADTSYAYASTLAPGARPVFLAGSCPLDDAGQTVAPGDVAAQTRQALVNLRTSLTDAGCEIDDIAFVRVLVASTERADLVEAWHEVRAVFGDHDPPGTLQGVTVLGYPDQLVEVEVVAAVSPSSTRG